VERVVPGDLRTTEHEPDTAIGQVETDRHLRVALVRAIAETHEPSQPLAGVVEVEVRALVVVQFAGVRVEEVVAVETDQTCGRHHRLLRREGSRLRVARPGTSMLRTGSTYDGARPAGLDGTGRRLAGRGTRAVDPRRRSGRASRHSCDGVGAAARTMEQW